MSLPASLLAKLISDTQDELGQLAEIEQDSQGTILRFSFCTLRFRPIADLHSIPAYLLRVETGLPDGVVCWRVVRPDIGPEIVNETDYRQWPPIKRTFSIQNAAAEIVSAIKVNLPV